MDEGNARVAAVEAETTDLSESQTAGPPDAPRASVPAIAFWHRSRPWPLAISGLALPNGVFLSDGRFQAGAGPLGLVLAGLAIGAVAICSIVLTFFIAYGVQRLLGVPLVPILLGTYIANHPPAHLWIWEVGVNLLKLFSFLVLMRASPLTGYHAAEHQTVHAIESGQELTLDLVKSVTPVHRRCGSNLVGPIFVILALTPLWWPRAMSVGMPQSGRLVGQWPWLLVIAPLAWRLRRQIGGFLQKHFLTKRPTEKQLRAGIESGRLLLHQHRGAAPPSRPYWPLWQRGMPQVALGMFIAIALAWFVDSHLVVWLDF